MFLLNVNHTSPEETQIFILQFCPALNLLLKTFQIFRVLSLTQHCLRRITIVDICPMTHTTYFTAVLPINTLFCRTHFPHAVITSLSQWALRSHFSIDYRRTGLADSLLLSKVALRVPTFMSMTVTHLRITTTAGGQKFISWLGDHRKGIIVHNIKFLNYISWTKAHKHNCHGKKHLTWQAPKIQPKENGIPSLTVQISFFPTWHLMRTSKDKDNYLITIF
jgi:hypothetical protein